MTLVELLVVVTIAVVLFAVAVPMLKSPMRENRLREASRQLSVMITGAKARAAETGRPVGILLERKFPLPGAPPDAVVNVYFSETPDPYAGDILGAKALVTWDAGDLRFEMTFPDGNSGSLASTTSAALIQPYERFRIRFGFQGALYAGYRADNGDYVVTFPNDVLPPGFWRPGPDGGWGEAGVNDDGKNLADDTWEAGWPKSDDIPVGQPYSLRRYPKKSTASPVQLPPGVAIDLAYSGFAVASVDSVSAYRDRRGVVQRRSLTWSGREFNGDPNNLGALAELPINIVFSPGGALDHVTWGGNLSTDPDSVHLLIGQLDKVGVVAGVTPERANPIPYSATDTTSFAFHENIADPANLWISIGARNGSVTTAENAWALAGVSASSTTPNFLDSFRAAREFAQSVQSMGGR